MVELPTPYEGVTDEILLELLADRDGFVRRVISNLKEENPSLVEYIVKSCPTSPDPESSLNWLLAYYEIFSRSARKNGRIMFEVSRERIRSVFAERRATLDQVTEEDEEAQFEFYAEEDMKVENIIQAETESARPLAEFWITIKMRRLKQLMTVSKTEAEVDAILHPLHDLSLLLHSQEEANKLASKWKINSS